MGRLTKYVLNHLSRPTVQRIAGVVIPAAGLFMRGRRVECPVCGKRFRKFFRKRLITVRYSNRCHTEFFNI